MLFEGYVQPVIATTYAGRPTKLDGNPDHPVTRGASDAFMQVGDFRSLRSGTLESAAARGRALDLGCVRRALGRHASALARAQGEGLRILTGATTSPTLIRQIGDLAKQYPKMRWSRFEPVGSARQDEAMKLAFGRAVTPHYRLDQCDVIVSLDHDLLGPGPHQVMHANAWAQRRGEIAPDAGPQPAACGGKRAEPDRHGRLDAAALRSARVLPRWPRR